MGLKILHNVMNPLSSPSNGMVRNRCARSQPIEISSLFPRSPTELQFGSPPVDSTSPIRSNVPRHSLRPGIAMFRRPVAYGRRTGAPAVLFTPRVLHAVGGLGYGLDERPCPAASLLGAKTGAERWDSISAHIYRGQRGSMNTSRIFIIGPGEVGRRLSGALEDSAGVVSMVSRTEVVQVFALARFGLCVGRGDTCDVLGLWSFQARASRLSRPVRSRPGDTASYGQGRCGSS